MNSRRSYPSVRIGKGLRGSRNSPVSSCNRTDQKPRRVSDTAYLISSFHSHKPQHVTAIDFPSSVLIVRSPSGKLHHRRAYAIDSRVCDESAVDVA